MSSDTEIRIEEAICCDACGRKGVLAYEKIYDPLFEAPGKWNLFRCSECGLFWVNPRPAESEIGKLYNRYYTHEVEYHRSLSLPLWQKIRFSIIAASYGYANFIKKPAWKLLGRVMETIPTLKIMLGIEIMCLQSRRKGRLLDIGCGNGKFLKLMKGLGWDVVGIEIDPLAADIARKQIGETVIIGSLEDAHFRDNSFDAITMSHVIEHVYNPNSLLRECFRILKPDGQLVILTPNIEGLGHSIFKAHWVSLEPPRHIRIFSIPAITRYVEHSGFNITLLQTTSFFARRMWMISHSLKKGRNFRAKGFSFTQRAQGVAFQIFEELIRLFQRSKGEEIFLIATKKDGPNKDI